MPKSTNKSRSENEKAKSVSRATTASVGAPKAHDNDENLFKYGDLLLDLTLQAVNRDMLLLRLVNRYARSFVDRRLFNHVILRTDTTGLGTLRVKPISAGTRQRLPVPVLRWSCPMRGPKVLAKYLRQYTAVLDLEMVYDNILAQFRNGKMRLPHLRYLRLKSDNYGYHTQELVGCFGAATVVVFPAYDPFATWQTPCRITLGGMSKFVQHLAFAIDWCGHIVFPWLPENNTIKDEVWVTHHLKLKVGYKDEEHGESEGKRSGRHKAFLAAMARRLKARVNLTLTGLDRGSTKWAGNTDLGTAVEQIATVLRADLLRHGGVTQDELQYLDFKTWDEYASTLSSEQLAMESLPLPSWRDKERKYREDVGPHTFLA